MSEQKEKVVLLIHGMGTHAEGNIIEEFKKGLKEVADGLGHANYKIEEIVDVEEYNYSDFLDDARRKIAEESTKVIGQLKEVKNIGGGLVDFIKEFMKQESKFKGEEFLYTHWLDVLFYGSTYYGEKVRIDLAIKIIQLIIKYGAEKVHIVAHSLGTAVLSDTMEKLYSDYDDELKDVIAHNAGGLPVSENRRHLEVGPNSISSIWTFANVSRMVHILNKIKHNKEKVMRKRGCANLYFNTFHKFDPFTFILKYKPDNTVVDANYINEQVRDYNTHNFFEYIASPQAGAKMLAILDTNNSKFYEKKPTYSARYDVLVEKHKKSSLQGVYQRMEEEFKDLKDGNENIMDLHEAIKQFIGKVKEIKNDI